jgi:hypothetical protein
MVGNSEPESTTESSSALASVTRLVQYCINTCSAVDAAQCNIPLLGRTVASQRKQMTLEEKAGQARHRSVGRTGFREMIASGRQTAPPQVFEVVSVTNSACPLSLEASPRVTDLPCVAISTLRWSEATAELFPHLAPVVVHAASRSRILSAPTVSRS